MSGEIRISEIFGPTIQGEGALIGLPTVFVRTGGCDYRCSWCDSLHAVDPEFRREWLAMSAQEIMAEVDRLSGQKPITISLSGGNPAIQPLERLIDLGREREYRFALETQGSIARRWFDKLDMLVLSPKPPSSKMAVDWDGFDACLAASADCPRTVIKIVVFDEVDYVFARDVGMRYPGLSIFLQPGNHTPPPPGDDDFAVDADGIMDRMLWLVAKVTDDQWYDARVLPQLHVLLWGNRRGV